jgi:ketosteroid isomerase-like protein
MSAIDRIKEFYRAREAKQPEKLKDFIAADVVWREPSVGTHMGELLGVDAVLDMMKRALATTGGTFSLEVAEYAEIAGHCAAVINWTAEKDGTPIKGRELAVFSVSGGKITFAQFLPENIGNDQTFWGETKRQIGKDR